MKRMKERLLIAAALLALALGGCTEVNPQTGATEPTALGYVAMAVGSFGQGFARQPGYIPPPQPTICQPRGDGSYQCQPQ